jgi:hypothetical protein
MKYAVDRLVKFPEEKTLTIRPLLYIPFMLMMPLLAEAGTAIVQGTAGDSNLLPASLPTPGLGNVINFANLLSQITSLPPAVQANCFDNGVDCPTFNSSQYASEGVTISSPDSLLIYPFSSQTAGGIELFDPGTGGDLDGTANITIGLAGGVSELAVGISEFDDPINLTIEALGLGGTDLASMNVSAAVEAQELAGNTGNTYFVAEDTTAGIYGLQITQTIATGGSGLALAEVEFTPEPSTFLLLIGGGLAMIGATRLHKKA